MLDKEQKLEVIKKHKTHDTDTGSTEVQIGLLSEEISRLLLHLKKNSKDFHSKRGLLKMVATRRKFLEHLRKEDEKSYKATVKKIGLKK